MRGLMIPVITGLCLILCASLPSLAAVQGRPRVPLAGEWRMQFTDTLDAQPGAQWSKKNFPTGENEVRLPEGKQAMWIEREVTVPGAWQGRRVALHIGKLIFAAAVYVNGTYGGDLAGYGGELDITKCVKYDQPTTIRLFFGLGGQGVKSVDKITRQVAERLEQRAKAGHDLGAYYVGVNCLPEQFYLEAQHPEILVSDVWYRAYTRGGVRITPQMTFTAEKIFSGLKARVLIYEEKDDTVARQGEFPVPPLKMGETEYTFTIPAERMKLWGIREPNLYRGQVILLDAAGQEIDRTEPTFFGIREFWTQGKDCYLNGIKTPFVADFAYNKQPLEEAFRRGINLTYYTQPYQGRFVTGNEEPLAIQCDKMGMGVMTNGIPVPWLDMTDPQIQQEYRVWAKEHIKRQRNHPSILFWGLAISVGGTHIDFSPQRIGRSEIMDWSTPSTSVGYLVHREMDPSRPNYFHGGPRVGDIATGNIYLNHMPFQEVEEWLSEWVEKGDRPIVVVEYSGTVLSVDYNKEGHSYTTEYGARLAGERAYQEELDENIAYQTYDVARQTSIWDYSGYCYSPTVVEQAIEGQIRTYRAWRYHGASVLSWIFNPDVSAVKYPTKDGDRKLWDVYRTRMISPIQVWIGGPEGKDWPAKDHNFTSGDRIDKSLMVIRDLNGREQWHIAWEVAAAGEAPVAKGAFDRIITPFAHTQFPFSFSAPNVTTMKNYTLTVVVTDLKTNTEVGRDRFALTIYPPRKPVVDKADVAGKTARVAIIDPEGATTAWLQARGLHVAPFNKARLPQVLILGRSALRDMQALPFTAADVAKGLRVVVFEQHCNNLGSLGFRHEDRAPRNAFVRQPGNPLATGLTNEALRDWQGAGTLLSPGPDGDRDAITNRLFRWENRGTVASAIIETPHFGPFVPIIDCEFDLGYTPLLSWRHGAGEIIFCQLDLTGRVGQEPAATLIADNLIKYLRTPLKTAQDKVLACLDAATVSQMQGMGFAAELLSPTLTPKRQVVVITGTQATLLPERRAQIASFAKAGGDVLVLYANAELLKDPLFGGTLGVSPIRVTRASRTVESHPLLTGVGPQQLHWRNAVDLQALASADPKFTGLAGGLIGVQTLGKGRLVFLQVDPQAMRDLTAVRAMDMKAGAKPIPEDWLKQDRKRSLWQANRLQSLLLANLGARSAQPLLERLFTMKRDMPMTPVNAWVFLGPFAPPTDENVEPLATDLSAYLKIRDTRHRFTNTRGEVVEWYFPTDSQNGYGLNGRVDMSRPYGIHLRDVAAAVTHIWSSRARDARIEVGADWWLKIEVNGKEYYRTGSPESWGIGFHSPVTVHLKQGWNEVIATVGAGTNGHCFWFRITNPGDLVVAQQTTTPAAPPANLPPVNTLIPDNVPKGYAFYTEEMQPADDPYQYIPW